MPSPDRSMRSATSTQCICRFQVGSVYGQYTEKVGNNDNGSTFSWSMIVAAFPNSTWLVLFRLIALNPLKLTLTLVCHVLVESFDHCANRNQVVLHGAFVPDNYFLLTFAPICQWSLTWIIMLHLKAHF